MHFYTTLLNISKIYIYNNNEKHFEKLKHKKTSHTNIAVNDLYDARLCGSNTV